MNIKDIEIIEIGWVDIKDYPDMVDAFCSSAIWIKDSTELTDEELNVLNDEYSDIIQDLARKECF